MFPSAVMAAQATSLGTIELYPTINSIGIRANFSGDDNANNSATLQFKKSADSAWQSGMALTVDRRSSVAGTANPFRNQWRGSVLWCEPHTPYDVRITLSDSDGASGSNGTQLNSTSYARISSITTRYEQVPLGAGRTFYVDGTTGNDARSLTEAQSLATPWRTISKAAASVASGDRVSIRAGTYKENVTVSASGSDADHYIAFVNYNQEEVWLDGSSGGGYVIGRNRLETSHGQVRDGIATAPRNTYYGGWYQESDFYDNTFLKMFDDMLQVDGGAMNLRIWGNTFNYSLNSGLSTQHLYLGPLHVFRNLWINAGCGPNNVYQATVIKTGSDDGRLYFQHNTVYGPSGDRTSWPGFSSEPNMDIRNNIINVAYHPLAFSSTPGGIVDYNSYKSFGSGILKASGGSHSLNGLDSRFVSPATSLTAGPANFALQSSSPLIDKGTILLQINDAGSPWPYAGAAPDLGAFEYGAGTLPAPAPTPAPLGNTFGLNSGDYSYNKAAGFLDVMRLQNTAGTGTLTKLELLVDDVSPNGKARLAVYADNGGQPGNLLLDAGEVTVTDGWNTITDLNLPVSQGSYYWLGFSLSKVNTIRGQTYQPTNSHYYAKFNGSGTLPAAYPTTGVGVNTNQYVMRAIVAVP